MKDFSTLSELVSFQASSFNNSRAFNFRKNGEWKSFSNQEFFDKSLYFACGLREIGLIKNQAIAIYSYQNPIWLIADLGSILAGAVTVPIFHNISTENLLYEISDAAVKYIFTDNIEFCEIIKSSNLDLKVITYGFEREGLISFDALILLGKNAVEQKKYDFESLSKSNSPQDLATIIYTSGSTGKPKGVELTHHNLVSQIKATALCFPLDAKDVALSFLPLAHIFERMVMMFYISQGISIYFSDDIKNVALDLKEINPSLMTAVPRVLEKIFLRIKEVGQNSFGIKKILVTSAINRALSKDSQVKKTILDKIYDHLVYQKFRNILGSKMKMIICGGAALSEDLERFYSNIDVNLYCGYGLTEASPVLSVNYPKSYKFATIGKAFPFVELKIAPDSELMARGPNIMHGYHNKAEKTAEIIKDGWLKTGDLAQIDKDGFVKIIGRKKELFKNANGKYIRPIPIEQKLVQNLGFLIGAIIIAEARKFTSVLLFPDFEILPKFKTKFDGKNLSNEDFLKSENLKRFVENEIQKINQNLDHWEQIKKFKIINDAISIETGEITPSMKLKRVFLEEKYKSAIEEFYLE